jgi:hypothetical protein
MKKILTLLVAVLATATVAHAQFGVIGGWTTSNTSINTKDLKENFKGLDNFHAGIAYHAKLPLGFAIQPELTYEMKGAKFSSDSDQHFVAGLLSTKSHGVELGVGVQWGVDLLVARPFLVAEPYIGYVFKSNEQYSVGSSTLQIDPLEISNFLNDAKNKLEYGISLGAGVDIVRHIQISVKWFKNLGPLYNEGKFNANSIYASAAAALKDTKNYQGIKVTLGIFF